MQAHRFPADFWAVIAAADEAFDGGDDRLVEWSSGRPLGVNGDGVSTGSLYRAGRWIESSAGYRVRSTGRAGFDYEDRDGPLHIDSEWMAVPKAVINTDSIPVERPQVLERVMRCWLWAGFDIELYPPNRHT